MPSQYAEYPVQGGSGGVSSLNGLEGALTLVAGSGISITPSGSSITIASTASSGANTALSNLTSPTAINQSLLFGTDGASSIGASLASRPSAIYVKNSVTIAGDTGVPGTLTVGSDNTGGAGSLFLGVGSMGATLQFGVSSNIASIDVGGGLFEFINAGVLFLQAGGDNLVFSNAPSQN